MKNFVPELINSVFDKFKKEDVNFCILRNFHKIPNNIGNDVDLLNHKKDNDKIDRILNDIADEKNFILWLEPPNNYKRIYIFQKFNKEKGEFDSLALDFRNDLEAGGVIHYSGKKVLNNVSSYKNFFIPSPKHQFLHICIHGTYRTPKYLDRYSKQIRSLLENNKKLDTNILKSYWPNYFYKKINKRIKKYKIKEALLFGKRFWVFFLIHNSSLITFIKSKIVSLFHKIKRRFIREGNFIVLTGPDGVGKTTVAKLAVQMLEQRYIPVNHLHLGFRPKVLPSRGDLDMEEPKNINGGDITKKEKNPHTRNLIEKLRFIYHALDYLFFYIKSLRPALIRNYVVIAERYFYDYLVRINKKRININDNFLWFVFKLFIPKADTFILLTANPEEIHRRKQELSINEIKKELLKWSEVGQYSKNFSKIDANQPKEKVAEDLVKLISDNYKKIK